MMRAVEAHSCRRHSPAGQCGAPFFCALDALAINDRSARAGVPPRQLPACHIERVVNAPERAVVVPSVEVVVQGAARRQVLGDRGPLAARAQDIHEAVDHLAQVDPPLVAAALGGRDQWGNQRPFLVAHVTWVAQLAPVVATTVLTRPHQRLPPDRTAAKGITTNSKHSRCSRMDTQIPCYYPPPHWHVFLLLNQQLTPISNRDRVESNYRRDATDAARREAVLVVSSGTLLT